MNLRMKLVSGFFAVAAITLIVSAIGYWQTQKLASALYEVGVIRLPSIQALDTIFEAKTALDASKRELTRPSSFLGIDPSVLAQELKRQQQAWSRAEKAWKLYEPLPRTSEEQAKWKLFVPAWNAWRTSYERVMTLLSEGRRTGDTALLLAAHQENDERLFDSARTSRVLLTDLIAINERIAADAKRDSISSERDTRGVRMIMIVAAFASVAGAIGCGLFMSRLIGRPIAQMSHAFSRIAGGDLETRVPVGARDEVGRMAEAMNGMMESLRTSELRFRAVFENTFDAIGVSNDGRMVIVNRALLTLFGYARTEDVVGRPVLDLIAPSDHSVVVDRRRRRQLGENLSPMMELTGLRRNGTTFTMEVRAATFMLNGEPHIVAVHRDITERQRSAAQLADSAGRLELALRTSNLGVWRRHLITHEAQWDVRMFAIFGLPPAASPPTREQLLALIVPEDRASAWKVWTAPPASDRTYEHRFRITRPDGQVRHLEVHGMIHETPGKAAEWAIGVTGDITEIVDAAAESTHLREQLVQAQKMETLGMLSAGIAHDFNNLLTGINGFIELAAVNLPPAHESVELLRQARQGTTSARDLVRRILNFSRQSRTSQRSPLKLNEVVRDTAPLISAALPTHLTVALDLAPDLPAVLADPGQIQQVLMNLCTNGAHAIGPQRGTLRLGLRPHTFSATPPPPPGCRAGDYVCLSVIDTGSGMDATTVKRIFEPFFTTKKPGEGTGLGLAIVTDIMAAHDGGLEVQSVLGRGTTFSLYFPCAHETPTVAATTSRSTTAGQGAGQRILVVDDEPTITKVVQLVLMKGGYAPEVHTSSLEAWDRFAQAPGDFTLLMIDQQMPGLGGADFIARARQLRPDLPVIRMSGQFEQSEAIADLPGIAHLKKPFEIADLLQQVTTSLRT